MPNSRKTTRGLWAKRARNAASCRIRAMKADMVSVSPGVEATAPGSAARDEVAAPGNAAKSPTTNLNSLRMDGAKDALPRS
jgi:hypothetical protein